MWFVSHSGTPGCSDVVSLDFDQALCSLREEIEPEYDILV